MARGFNLTAEINLRGPSNIRTVVADIRRQLGTVTANVNLSVNPSSVRTINSLNQSLTRLNTVLRDTRSLSNQAVTALNSLSTVGTRVSSSISTLPRNVQAAAAAVNTLTRNTNASAQATQRARTEFEEFGRQSALAVRRFAAFTLGTAAIVKLNNAISSGVREFIAFDKELVRVSQVTGTSVKNLDSLVGQITSLSTSLGVTSEDLISVSSTLAQAGLSARDTEKALKALALSALAPSFDSLQNTVEGSIALMRQFGISAGDLEKALGSVNAVAAKFAVESGDIITAIQRTGGVFAAASRGVSGGTDALNEFIAVFTSVRATTRESAETIATGLRTIFTRIQRGDTIDALKQYGVVLTDLEGKFVGPYEAVRRLAEGLNQLDPRDLRFSRIVEELGGFRQIGKVIPLIQQFTTAQQALIVAQRGQGSLATDAAIAQQALANKISKVREEFVSLIRSVSQSQSFQNFIDLSLNLTSALIGIADAAKSVLPAITAITAIRGASFLAQFATGFYGGMRRPNTGGARGNANGGMIRSFANGGEVPVVLMPGEAVIYPEQAKRIGAAKLNRMNYADKRMAKGGRVGIVPGSGNTDSFHTSLPVGSYVIRKKATEAMGINTIADIAQGRKEYASGGPVKATQLKSVAIKQRVKSANSNIDPEDFKSGKYLTDTDLIYFDKAEYGLKASKNIRFDTFEDKVGQKIGGKPVGGNKPIDIPKNKFNRPIEVRNRNETTKDPELLDKLLRYNLLTTNSLVSNRKQKDNNLYAGKIGVAYNTSKIQRDRFVQLNRGGNVQKFMSGAAVKPISPASLLAGPGGIDNWTQLRDDLLRKKGLAFKDGNLILSTGQTIPFKKAIDKTPNAQVRTALAGAGIDGSVLRAELEGLYSGRRGAVVEATRPRTPQEVSAAQQKSLLFGAAGMYGKRFPATPMLLTQKDGLKQPTEAVVFGSLLDRDAAEKQSRLKKREIMLQASGVAGGRNTGTTEIEAAPTSKGLSKFFGYQASVTGVSKANKQLAIDTLNSITNTLSPGTQGSQIFLDFDRTLAFGADKIAGKINKKAPDYSAFSDLKQVAGGLGNAKLSGLGLRLRKLVTNLDNKSPGLGNELLRRMFVVSARPQQTMPLIARWTRNQGLRIPPGNFSGVGGAGVSINDIALAKAEKISSMAGSGSVFIDDDKKNIAAARDKGITSIQYGSSISKKSKRQAAQQEGLQFEKFISDQLPASLKTGIFGTNGEDIDFPLGLGSRIANYWFKDQRLASIPVDTKRTINSPSTIKDNVVTYLKNKGYASGGYIQKLAKAGKVKQPPEDNYYGQPEVEAARKAWRSFKRATRKAFADDQVYIETQVPKSISASGGIDIPESEKLYGTGIDPKLPKGTPAILGSKRIRPSRAAAAAPAAKADLKELARVKKLGSEQDQLAAGAFKPLLDEIAKKNPQAAAALASGLSKPGTASGFLLGQGLGGVDKKLQSEYTSTEESISAFKSSGKLDISTRFASFFRSNLASMLLEAKTQLGSMDPQKAGYKQLRQYFNNLRNTSKDFQALTRIRPGKSSSSKSSIDVQGRRTFGSQILNKILEENFQGFASGGFTDRVKSNNIMSKQLSAAEMIKAAKQVGYKLSELDNGMIEFIKHGQVFHTLNRQQASEFLHSRLTGGYASGGEVPIMAQKGEYVINRKSARAIGYENLHALNKYHTGGIVGSPQKLAKGGPPQKLAEAVGSFDAVSQQAAQALAQAMKTAIAQEFKNIRTNNPTMPANDALQKARANVQPVTNFGAFRAAETGDQNAANMVADAQRKQVNAIIKQIRAADSSVAISQAKAAAERRVADAWGGLYKRTKEQEQQASLLSRAMARVSGLYGKIRGSDLTPEKREQNQRFRDRVASFGMGLAFTAPMLADQAGQSIGGPTGQALSAATSTASTFAAIGTQLAPMAGILGPLGPIFVGLGTAVVGVSATVDSWNKALIDSEIELNKTKIEKESQKTEKTLATLSKDPKNVAATQDLIKSLDAMSSAEKNIQDSRRQIRTQPTMMGRLKSLVGYDTTTPEEVQNNKEYQTELKKLQERNLNATEFAAEKRELVAKFTAQEVGQANAAQSRARSEIAMQALVAKGSQGLTIDEALGSFGSDAGKIQESIAAGSQKYAAELEKLVQDAAASGMSSAELDKRKKSLIQKYYLEETETLRAAMADQARAKAANKVAKALNTAVTSIERTFGNMEAALGRGADALAKASASLDAMAAGKSDLQNAFAGQNILENPRAYSRRERAGAVRQSAGFFGRDAGFVEKLTSTVGSDIKDSLTSIAARAQTTGASKEATAQEIQRSVDQQLTAAFGNNDLTRQLSEQIRIQLDTQLKNKDTEEIDLDQLLAASTGLTSLIESEKKAFELLAQGTKQVSQALDLYTSKLVTATEMLNEVDAINAESISMRASNDFRLREMLGQGRRVPLGERLAARSQEAAARAGLKPNELNTRSLLARLGTLEQTRVDMQQRRAQFQEGRSFTDPATMQGIQRFNAGLINLDNQIAKTKSALKNLPKDIQGAIDDVAGAMEDRLSKIESKREAGTGFAERMVTSTPTELANLGSTYNVLNNALNGQARTIQQSVAAQMAYQKVIQDGGTAVEAMTAAQSAYADENKQVFSLFNELVAVGGIDKQQANTMRADLLETMARSQGLNMQNNPLFNQIIANLRRAPEEDPEIKRLKTLYEQLQQTQQQAAEAVRQLVIDDATALVKSAGDAVKTAIETARISFNEQQLADMGLGLSRPGQVMNKAEGGLIYASTGKLINFKPKGTDTVPAMLTPGEFVVNARATKQNLPLLQSINKSGGGPVQYFAAGTAKPVSMSRNASTPITTPAQARNFYDDIMQAWGVPAGGYVTPNPARSKPAQAASAPKPTTTTSNTTATTLATTKPAAPNIQTDPVGFINHYSDQFKGTPYYDESRKLLEQQVRAYDILNGSSARGDQRKAASAAWKDFLQRARGGDGSVPTAPKPTVSSTTPPAAATTPKPAADVAATPRPATTAANSKPSTTTSKPAPATSFVYDPDNLLPDTPNASAAKDVIAQRGPLMDYDAIQPDAGGTMRTTTSKPSRGLFGGFRLPTLGRPSLRGAAGLGMRAASMGVRGAVGLTRSTASSMLPVMALNAVSEMMGLGSLSNEAASMTGIGIDSLMAGVRGAIPGRAASSVPIRFPFGGTIRTLPQQAARLSGYNTLRNRLPNVGNSVLRGRNWTGARLPSGAGGAGGGGTAGGLRGFAGGARGAAASAIALNTAISGITEGASFLYDREGYSNRLATEEENEYANARNQSGIGYALGQGLSGFTNPFRMFGKFGRAAYSTSEATAQNQAQQQAYDARNAQQRQDWSMGGRMQMLEGNEGDFAGRGLDTWVSARAPVYLDTATGQKYDMEKRADREAFDKIRSGDRLAAFGLTGIERGWVNAKTQLEEDKAQGKITEEEYNKRNEDLIARRNVTTTRYNRGYLWNTETKEKLMTSDKLDQAVAAERRFRADQRAKEENQRTQAEQQKREQAEKDGQRYYDSVRNTVQTGSTLLQAGAQAAWNYGQNLFSAQQEAAAARENRINMHNSASLAMARPVMPEYVDKFKELAERRARLEKQYSELSAEKDDTEIVGPFGSSPVPEVELKAKREERKKQQEALQREIDEINSSIVKQQREGNSIPQEERQKAWNEHNKAKASAEAKAQRETILAEKREINDAKKRRFAAESVLIKISGVPAPRNPERVPEWRAKSLEKIRDKFNLSGDPEKDIQLMTAYGMSPELAKGLFRPLTEDQNKAVYELLSQQTQRGQYKYSDSDLQLLKMSRQQIMEKVNKGELKGSTLARKEILETAREKEFAKSFKNMRGIDSIAARGMSLNERAKRGFRQRILNKLIKLGYIDPRIDDSTNAQRLSALNLNANTVSFIYPAQVGGMLAGKVDNAQQKSLGGVVYASTGKLINFKPRGTDTVPAMLTPGEFVVNARATQQHLPMLQAINKAKGGRISYYDDGGSIPMVTATGPQESSNIRAQQQALTIQKQTADKLNSINTNTNNTVKTTQNIDNNKLPSLSTQAQNFQETALKNLSGLSDLSNQNLTRTSNVGNYLDTNNFPGRFDTVDLDLDYLVKRTRLMYLTQLPDIQAQTDTIPKVAREIIAAVVDPNIIAGGVALAGPAAGRQLAQDQMDAINRFSRGGMVYASNGMLIPYKPRGTDTVPAMLTPGEFVVNRSATKANLPLLQAINGGAKGFSSGGQVNYMADGGILGQLFAPMLGTFKGLTSAVQLTIQALQTYQKQLASTQPNSVSNTSGIKTNLDGLSEFTAKFDQFIVALNSIKIPPIVNLQVAPVTVNITGAEALVNALEGPLGGMLQAQIAGAMNRLSAQTEGAIPT